MSDDLSPDKNHYHSNGFSFGIQHKNKWLDNKHDIFLLCDKDNTNKITK